MTRREIEKLMLETFGPDWERKVVVSPLGSFPLRDVYVECGLEPPISPNDHGVGLFQIAGPRG